MSRRALALALLTVTPLLAGCVDSDPSVDNPIEPCGQLDTDYQPDPEYNPRIELDTSNGTITVLVYGRQVPFTAGHVFRLIDQGVWDDTRFHRLIPDEVVLGGDPRSRNEDRNAWGTGGYNYKTVDEFHQFLRHDEPGILSMKSPQPNSVGSQFAITLAPQPSFDDRNPVVGKVIDGMENASELAETPTDDKRRPLYDARLFNATRLPAPSVEAPDPELTAYGFDCVEVGEPGGEAEFLVTLRNTGQSVLNGTLTSNLDDVEGWDVELRNAEDVVVSSGQTVAYMLNVTVPEDAETGSQRTVELGFEGRDSDASTQLDLTVNVGELGASAVDQDEVDLRYVGVLEDGRAFDATVPAYTDDPSVSWFRTPPSNPQPATLPISSETLNQSAPGQLVQRAQLGETVVGQVPPGDAYGAQTYGENNLGGRLLIFQVQVIESQ